MAFATDAFDAVLAGFRERLVRDLATLVRCRTSLQIESDAVSVLEDLQTNAHKMAGAAGIFGFAEISRRAAMLEDSVIERRAGRKAAGVEANLDALVVCIEDSSSPASIVTVDENSYGAKSDMGAI